MHFFKVLELARLDPFKLLGCELKTFTDGRTTEICGPAQLAAVDLKAACWKTSN
jgi:hypothetical protein